MEHAHSATRARDRGGDIWAGVDRLIDHAPRLSDLRNHGIELFAARRWRTLGRPVPTELVDEERRVAALALGAPAVLERARAAYGGGMVLLKGPEVAARYPDPALRRFHDLDLLVEHAEEAQRALLSAGFEPVGDPELYVDIHHLRPLWISGIPLPVELHSRPKWIDGLPAPPAAELFSVAIASSLGVDGILALPPAHHALLLAAHSWAHEPLRRLRDVIDVAAMIQDGDRSEASALARDWGILRVWDTTIGAADAIFRGCEMPWALRLWARNLATVRERTVLESHLERWLSNFWALPRRQAIQALTTVLVEEIRPGEGETWRSKLARTGQAVRNARVRRSEHNRELDRKIGPKSG